MVRMAVALGSQRWGPCPIPPGSAGLSNLHSRGPGRGVRKHLPAILQSGRGLLLAGAGASPHSPFGSGTCIPWGFPHGSAVKNPPAMQET